MPAPTAAPPHPAEFASIVRRHTPLVRATAMRVLRSHADADDVVQETFLAAWTHLDTIEDEAAIAGWLVTTARRRSYDRLRTTRHRPSAPVDESIPVVDDDLPTSVTERVSLALAAREVLATMPPPQRRCWQLRHLDGLSYDEVARALDVPVTTVRGMLARARATLSRELAAWR